MNVLNSTSILFLLFTPLLIRSFDDHILSQLQELIDATSDDEHNQIFLEQLNELLQNDEGFEIIPDRERRSIDDQTFIVDGSGDFSDEEIPPVFTNLSIVAITMGPSTTAFAKYTPQAYPSCPCQKGDRGEKGEPGICPTDCARGYTTYHRDCLGRKLNVERLAQSIRQLITDAKQIALRNARTNPCACSVIPSTSTISTPIPFDYNMYARLKGEKGDRGDSCPSVCPDRSQSNVRVFRTVEQAIDASSTYPDHTYVHIVNDYGQLQGVFIHIHGRLIPIRLEGEVRLPVHYPSYAPGPSIPSSSKCTWTLGCPTLHMFALGPNVRRMCHPGRSDLFCSKLSEFDDLCTRVAETHHLKGYYRAFMSTSTQWLSNLFAGICVSAKIVNMKEQTLFDEVEDIFEQKAPKSEIYDVQGSKPQFQYWWHGSLLNGTGSSDTCSDWSGRDSRLSGMASRLPDGSRGLFHSPYTWPCSISDSNMGILCIETNCDKRNSYKH